MADETTTQPSRLPEQTHSSLASDQYWPNKKHSTRKYSAQFSFARPACRAPESWVARRDTSSPRARSPRQLTWSIGEGAHLWAGSSSPGTLRPGPAWGSRGHVKNAPAVCLYRPGGPQLVLARRDTDWRGLSRLLRSRQPGGTHLGSGCRVILRK